MNFKEINHQNPPISSPQCHSLHVLVLLCPATAGGRARLLVGGVKNLIASSGARCEEAERKIGELTDFERRTTSPQLAEKNARHPSTNWAMTKTRKLANDFSGGVRPIACSIDLAPVGQGMDNVCL